MNTTEEVSSGSNEMGKLAMLQSIEGGTKKLSKAIGYFWVASSLFNNIKNIYKKFRSNFSYRIIIEENDSVYVELHQWLIDTLPPVKQRSVILETDPQEVYLYSKSSNGEDEDVTIELTEPFRFLFDGTREQVVIVGGFKIRVQVEKQEVSAQRYDSRIVFTCMGLTARDAVVQMIKGLAKRRTSGERVPRLYIASSWGSWTRRTDLRPREIDSVVLRNGVVEELVEDFQTFKDREPHYIKMGIPYHKGYLFYGPPGGGKTSIAKALASEFGRDLYYLPLSDIDKDVNLINMVSQVPAGSILLLEDIDVAHAATERDDESTKPTATLSGLLNSLDGVATPHGLITIMTTNNIDSLDPALIREGRVDMKVEIDYVDAEQLTRLFKAFTSITPEFQEFDAELTSAQVVTDIMRNLDDPEAAFVAVTKRIAKKS